MSRAGRLSREISIYKRPADAKDAKYGADTDEWEPLVPLAGSPTVAERFPAEVLDLLPSREEGLLAEDLEGQRSLTRIRLRWRSDIDATMKVVLHGDSDVELKIVGGPAEVEGRRQMIELLCEESSS